MTESKLKAKSFVIGKKVVLEAWEDVKSNRGAPGVDGESVEDFEGDLEGNLYKVWNRLSSGSYMPPVVRAVQIPKPHGLGVRTLGVPTVADRVAQTVVRSTWSLGWSLCFIRTHMGIGRDVRRMMRCGFAGSGVGNTFG